MAEGVNLHVCAVCVCFVLLSLCGLRCMCFMVLVGRFVLNMWWKKLCVSVFYIYSVCVFVFVWVCVPSNDTASPELCIAALCLPSAPRERSLFKQLFTPHSYT